MQRSIYLCLSEVEGRSRTQPTWHFMADEISYFSSTHATQLHTYTGPWREPGVGGPAAPSGSTALGWTAARWGAAHAWRTREGWTGRPLYLDNNKEVFGAEALAIYQAVGLFDARLKANQKYSVFLDSQSAIRRVMTDAVGPGQQGARAAEVCSRLMTGQNKVIAL